MGFLTNLFNRRIPLTEQSRELIYKLFGNFGANYLLNSNTLIEKSYGGNTDVYSIIKKIIDVSKSVEWVVEKKDKSGVWLPDTNNTISDLIERPNITKNYTWDDIEEQVLLFLLCTGNSYLYGSTRINRSLIEELDILPSKFVCVEENTQNFFMPIPTYKFNLGLSSKYIDQKYLAHLKYFNPAYSTVQESLVGLSPIQVANQVIQVSNDTWDASASLLQNRGAIGLITDKSNRPMTPEEAKTVQADFNSQTSGMHNYGKIKVTNKDLSYIQMAMSPEDLQLIEKGVVNLRALCNVYGLDSSLFNDPENKTYNNRLEAEKAMYTNAIIPLSSKLAEMYTRFICWNHYPDKSYRMRQSFESVEVLQSNKKDEAEKDKIVLDGIKVIMEMPITQEAKVALVKETYDISEEVLNELAKPVIIINQVNNANAK